MSVAGYNVKGEWLESVAGVELGENGKATLFIDAGDASGAEIPLTYYEVCELAAQLAGIRAQMEWDMAHWLFASTMISKKTHLMRKGSIKLPLHALDHEMEEQAACGQKPPSYGWSLTPAVSGPHSDCCKRCLRIYGQMQHEPKRDRNGWALAVGDRLQSVTSQVYEVLELKDGAAWVKVAGDDPVPSFPLYDTRAMTVCERGTNHD